jgi:hypothetical protein
MRGFVFVEAHSPLPLPFNTARAALDAALADGGLIEESKRAADEGASFLMRVGPGGSRGFAKQVLVEVLPFGCAGRKVVVPLRWQPTGTSGRLFLRWKQTSRFPKSMPAAARSRSSRRMSRRWMRSVPVLTAFCCRARPAQL